MGIQQRTKRGGKSLLSGSIHLSAVVIVLLIRYVVKFPTKDVVVMTILR